MARTSRGGGAGDLVGPGDGAFGHGSSSFHGIRRSLGMLEDNSRKVAVSIAAAAWLERAASPKRR